MQLLNQWNIIIRINKFEFNDYFMPITSRAIL